MVLLWIAHGKGHCDTIGEWLQSPFAKPHSGQNLTAKEFSKDVNRSNQRLMSHFACKRRLNNGIISLKDMKYKNLKLVAGTQSLIICVSI